MNNSIKNNISEYSRRGFHGIPKHEAEKEIKKHPEVISYCKANFWQIACPDECPYYQKCFFLNWENESGCFPVYPLDY